MAPQLESTQYCLQTYALPATIESYVFDLQEDERHRKKAISSLFIIRQLINTVNYI